MKNKEKHTLSLKRLISSFSYAFEGIYYLIKHEKNFQIHALAVMVVSIAGIYFQLSPMEWCVITLCFMIVLLGEAMNSALEKVCDLITEEYRSLIKIAKDTAAAGVLLAAIGSVIIAFIIFGNKIYSLLHV